MVPNAVLVDSAEIQSQTQYFLDFVLENQDESGWLGPEVFDTSKPRYLWARYVLLISYQRCSYLTDRIPQVSIPLWRTPDDGIQCYISRHCSPQVIQVRHAGEYNAQEW